MGSTEEYLTCSECSTYKSPVWKINWGIQKAFCTNCCIKKHEVVHEAATLIVSKEENAEQPGKACADCETTRAPYWRKGLCDDNIRCNACWLRRRKKLINEGEYTPMLRRHSASHEASGSGVKP